MPTPNPRISVTLKPVTAELLRRLSMLTGNSQSSMVSELLESSEGVFQRMLLVLEAAQRAKDETKREISSSMEKAQDKLERQLGIVMDSFDDYTGDLLAELETVKRRGRTPAARSGLPRARTVSETADASANRPPISNRGVRSTPNNKKQQLTNRGKGVKK